jgi:hypothetical protein
MPLTPALTPIAMRRWPYQAKVMNTLEANSTFKLHPRLC